MKKSKQKKLYIQYMIKSLNETPKECFALVKALEEITNTKQK